VKARGGGEAEREVLREESEAEELASTDEEFGSERGRELLVIAIVAVAACCCDEAAWVRVVCWWVEAEAAEAGFEGNILLLER